MSTWHEKLANRKQDQLDAERKKKVEVNDISFPSLTESSWGAAAGGAGGPAQNPKPKLASLLVEWDAKAEEEKARKAEAEAEAKRNTSYSTYSYNHSKYRFGNTHSRDEDTYYEDEYEDELPPLPSADSSSDWRTVERPSRKPKKTAVEKMMEEPEIIEPMIEESVWQTEGVWERER